MLTLIIGGAASGKSEYAETLPKPRVGQKLFYIATMKPEGEGAGERIEKHKKMRADKGFITIESPLGLKDLKIPGSPEGSVILLEDLGNLVANEQFDIGGTDDEIICRVMEGIRALMQKAEDLYVVGDDIFSDTEDYDADTLRYIRLLGNITRMVADMADKVTRVICGIPVSLK